MHENMQKKKWFWILWPILWRNCHQNQSFVYLWTTISLQIIFRFSFRKKIKYSSKPKRVDRHKNYILLTIFRWISASLPLGGRKILLGPPGGIEKLFAPPGGREDEKNRQKSRFDNKRVINHQEFVRITRNFYLSTPLSFEEYIYFCKMRIDWDMLIQIVYYLWAHMMKNMKKNPEKTKKTKKSANLGNNVDFLGLLNPQKMIFFSPNHLESLNIMFKYHIEVKC